MDKIVCFGKNYTEHMYELGDAPVVKPVIFLKPASILRQAQHWGDTVSAKLVPDYTTHYECELVLQLASGGYNMTQQQALASISAYTVGLDMTLRNLQAELKQAGHPWTTAKVFPDAAIIGPWINTTNLDFLSHDFSLQLNGTTKQHGKGQQMIYSPIELIMQASKCFPLCAGDILFTGTPAGVGQVQATELAKLSIAQYSYQVQW